jgi:hypothetical protein
VVSVCRQRRALKPDNADDLTALAGTAVAALLAEYLHLAAAP